MKTVILFSFLLIACQSFAQSISGNLKSEKENATLKYGNVDVYKNGKLVASVLTDKEGNFHIPLDTGKYTCVISYAGFLPETKEIMVRGEETSNFTAKADPAKPVAVKKNTDTRSPEKAASIEPKMSAPKGIGGERGIDSDLGYFPLSAGWHDDSYTPAQGGTKGKLTAGEINDFSKWSLWKDIAANDLVNFQTAWSLAPKGRYTFQLTTKSGIPIVDAVVHLMDGEETRFTTKTDNTGKAECWLTITNNEPTVRKKLWFKIIHGEKTLKLEHVTAFENGLNKLAVEVTCEQSENVDIAFVVDATGSMGDEMSYLQAEMNDIIFQSKQLSNTMNFRFANVFYRDKGQGEAYLTKKMDFTRVLSEAVAYIDEQSAGGGGDYEEAVEEALEVAINELDWSASARTRILFLILDAPPHNTALVQERFKKIMEQAAAKGIRIVPIGASGINKSTEYLMRALALSTNGTYTFLTDHSGIGGTHLAPTTDKYDVETLNDLMVRIIKSYTYMPTCEQELPNVVPNLPDSIVRLNNDSVPADTTQKSNPLTIQWSYYPNPTNGIVNILPNEDINELYITDLSGKVLIILTNLKGERTIQVDLSDFATGIYLIRYPVGDQWISGKVVLQRTS